VASLGRLLTGRVDRSVSLRLAESRSLLARLRTSGWPSRLFGHGLGATFDAGRGTGDSTNYVHNFYLFLLFKLGLVGTVLVLAAFALWCRYLLVALLARRAGTPARVRLAAALAAWLAYLLWSVSSPEILDFRIAPLWGLLLAAAVADSSVPSIPPSVDLPDGAS
jgi:O-antigen ligase